MHRHGRGALLFMAATWRFVEHMACVVVSDLKAVLGLLGLELDFGLKTKLAHLGILFKFH